jgi:hypothetical protein
MVNLSRARTRRWLWPRLIIWNLAGGCLLWSLRDQVISHQWQRVQGSVLDAEVLYDHAYEHDCLRVTYLYHVAGEGFLGHRYTVSGGCLSTDAQNQAQFPAGRRLGVWYDQRHPEFAVLNLADKGGGIWLWYVLLTELVLGNAAFIKYAQWREIQPAGSATDRERRSGLRAPAEAGTRAAGRRHASGPGPR